jgi:rhodanese-related sulfurtransferase
VRLSSPAQVAIILFTSAVCAIASQYLLPNRIPWRGDWDHYVESKTRDAGVVIAPLAEAKAIVDEQSRVILDARPVGDYEAGHLPGAFSLPESQIDLYFGPLMPLLAFDAPVMTYCTGKDCDEALLLTQKLAERKVTNVVMFLGGMEEWKASGYPIEGAKK